MTVFTGTFNYPTTNRLDLGDHDETAFNVSASATVTLSLQVDAAAGALAGSIWGRVTGTGTISNYLLNAVAVNDTDGRDHTGFPHTGTNTQTIADHFQGAPDINIHWWSISGDSISFDGNYFVDLNASNGLNLAGTQINGKIAIDATGLNGFPPDITRDMTLTTLPGFAVPTLYNLAGMSAWVEGLGPSPNGWPNISSAFGGGVVTFANQDFSEVVIDIRGTVTSNLSDLFYTFFGADSSFVDPHDNPTPEFRQLVSNASAVLGQVVAAHPQAHITLTGHSLGGAIAQLLGYASSYSTVAYDAPGAMQLFTQLQNELSVALALGARNTHPEGNVDIRVEGDGVSLIDEGRTINLVTLNSSVQVNEGRFQIPDNHSILLILQELRAPGTTVYQGVFELNSDVANFGSDAVNALHAILSTTQTVARTSQSLLFPVISAAQHLWIDPSAGTQFVFSNTTSSPAITSVTFLDDPNIASYQVWSQIGDTWSAPQIVAPGIAASFGAGTHAVKFEAFSSTGQPVSLPNGFLFDATFASAGQVNATLQSINLDNLNGTNVQTASPGQTSLTVNPSFAYTDAGDFNLTVVGTASANDTILLGSGNKTVNLGGGNDFVMVKAGATGNIVIHGGAGDETILAGAANVTLIAGTGNILFVGGDDANANVGVNTIDYSALGGAVNVNLAAGVIQTSNGAINTLVNVENVTGSPFADNITGDSRANQLFGGAGNDVLTGSLGNDTIDGGPGFDTAIFAGLRSAYTLTNLGGGSVRVTGPDGIDTLSNVESLVFDDQTVPWPPLTFAQPTFELAAFGVNAGGWTSDNTYPRMVADVNGDHMADIVGFGNGGVWVARGTGGGHFAPPTFELAAFGPNAGGWSSDNTYPRLLADVNNDHMADIVGFGNAGVWVALATPGGHFAQPTFQLSAFGPNAGGWSSDDTYPRQLADVNNDQMADIVGFGNGGVWVALATGGGHFAQPTFELAAFGPNAGGWSSDDTYPRQLADVNGDHMADIVGFGNGGVWVALATGGGHFAQPTFELAAFGRNAGGWSSDNTYPRMLADVNHDNMADIVGFGNGGVWVALATGGGHFAQPTPDLSAFGLNAGGWTSDNTYPRVLADLNNDHMADIVGFGNAGVWVSLSHDLLGI
jgi:RTX calcium-binding nonapeptide repeat (4 copies)/FG-GAP-like repeat/Lipase (class 3)